MNNLSQEQENALATFKNNTHLPGNGFHGLIIELCREYQLPFQPVRAIFMQCQKVIENKIQTNFENINEEELTKEHWVALIREQLQEMAKDNVPLLETLTNSARYRELMDKLSQPAENADELTLRLALLEDIYEYEVCNPLKAMLRTSPLSWAVKRNLFEMTEEQRAKFAGYPEHMQVTLHLLELGEKIKTSH